MNPTNGSLGPGGTNKRKAPEGASEHPSALTYKSDHTDTMDWLQTILGDASYAQAKSQLEAANAGAIDGEVLFSLESSAELKCVFVGVVASVLAMGRTFEEVSIRLNPGPACMGIEQGGVWLGCHPQPQGLDPASGLEAGAGRRRLEHAAAPRQPQPSCSCGRAR